MNEILDSVGTRGQRKIKIGKAGRASSFSVTAEALDGRITIITGRKESGKSHLAKMMVRGLLDHGAYCIIFDLNDEYASIGLRGDGSKTRGSGQGGDSEARPRPQVQPGGRRAARP